MYSKAVKRILDIVLSFLAIIVLAPVFVVIALCIKIDSKGPVFFTQKRVGKNKTFFSILKFRTMYADTPKDVPTHLLQNPAARITKVGHFLRHTSLDELPQILNIFTGKMSIIGPRPALWNQDDLIAERDKYGANALVPGLTGYAQINGRDELPIPIKAELDGYYAQNISFVLDVKIFFKTITNVFKGSGVVDGKQ
ncbi:sugar transferase [Ruminococcaceae bacterium OttesenSCG-928-A16]|nr:sugar transferase [Ruminococcaceae bacterium OttesenSCG-928-A16]